MAGERRTFREEEKTLDQDLGQAVGRRASPTSLAELSDLEVLLRTIESNPSIEPTLERWTQFNERVMMHILETATHRPTIRQRRQILLDRLTASDLAFKRTRWFLVVSLLLALIAVVVYLIV
jgi:hypothetical protein